MIKNSPKPSDGHSESPSSRPMTLRQQLEAKVIFMRKYNQISNEGWNEALDDLVQFCQEIAREAVRADRQARDDSKHSETKSLTVDAGAMLGDYQFDVALENSVPKTNETVLVAPNKRIQKQWEKEYPGIKVILQAHYRGYAIPSGLLQFGVSDLVATESDSKRSSSNPPESELTQKPPQPQGADSHTDIGDTVSGNEAVNREEA